MVKRGPTHVIDTLAVRAVLKNISENWLIRGMEERDYGIDLTLEIFDGEHPTGKLALIQVKGTSQAFDDQIKISDFPTRTLEYSLLFQEPFFVFYVSTISEKVYFIWIQKYVAAKLDYENPKWRNQGQVTLTFPKENSLNDGKQKIEEIMSFYSARTDGLEYLAALEWLKDHWNSYSPRANELIDSCLFDLKKVCERKIFLSVYGEPDTKNTLLGLKTTLEILRDSTHDVSSDELAGEVDQYIEKLDIIKHNFLNRSDIDRFCVEHSDSCPY